MSRVRRVRDYGFAPGILKPGPRNDITDVSGVLVGHRTVVDAKAGHRTGVTAIRPHGGNMFLERVPAGLCIGNGHGKLAGATQIEELGELETPILLVNTLATGRAIEALIDWTLAQPGCEGVTSVNAVVGETNDSPLNNIRERGIRTSDVLQALDDAVADPVQQGSVGAGAGTMAFGLKGGIGSSSRLVPAACGGWCTAALVQANFDGILQIDGRNVGKELAHLWRPDHPAYGSGPGSIMIVVATD
ncbi:MAG: P1 family peptidase, partial [Haliea sp.]|uniref:P1 family peptidase n=1 Tax=Haliea sp. TaxID=1932666 RepID=UPI0032EDCE0E